MYKKFLISYNDDNHYKKFWFDNEFLGTEEDIADLLITMFNYGIEEGEFSNTIVEYIEISIFDFDEEDTDRLHNLLSKEGNFSAEQWENLTKQNFKKVV